MAQQQFKGLTSEEVSKSRNEYGNNVITPAKGESVWKLFIGKFKDPIIKVLLVAACLSLAVACVDGEFAETIGILCAIILATGVSFWFEYDAKRRFDVLNQVNDDVAVKVIRDDNVQEIPRRDVVRGDIVLLEAGEEIPADGELLETVSMTVNESSLTGEPLVSKETDAQFFDQEATYPSNMAMRGTTVTEGRGTMRVIAVGDATEFGRVAQQATVKSEEKTPLDLQLEKLSRLIGKIGTTLAIAIFAVMLIKGFWFGGLASAGWLKIIEALLQYFMVSVAIMVMAIPEGLPMSISLSLAVSMRKMLKTNNLVRKMHACETMGAVTVICTDKTGTLTMNQMRVHEIIRYGSSDDTSFAEQLAANTTAFLDQNGKAIGNPTEGALLLWLRDHDIDYRTVRNRVEIIDQIPFSTERKYMATLLRSADGTRKLYVKGAPEIVKAMCTGSRTDEEIDARLLDFQNKAMRTLGFACTTTEATAADKALQEGRLEFVGIAAISDPVRPDVPAAVGRCLDAGIKVKIVTGDTPATAREIARQIGLWDDNYDGEQNRITGAEFAAMSDEQLLERVEELKIMSRARPLDKQRLVRLLQSRGAVVAVTGDGTNDAPALNFAQVGLSMGSGTSVAKEASDITLLDDSFSSIATAVLWGRSLYRNIQRFVMFQLTINFAAIIVVFIGSIIGNKLPLTVTQILWINLIMDTFAAMAFASLPPDPKVMLDKPRKKSDFIITRPMYLSIASTGLLFVAVLLGLMFFWGPDMSIRQLTMFFTVFVMLQVWNMFNVKTFGENRSAFHDLRHSYVFVLIVLLIVAGQVAIVNLGGEVFRTTPISFKDWMTIIGTTSIIMFGGEIIRAIKRKVHNDNGKERK